MKIEKAEISRLESRWSKGNQYITVGFVDTNPVSSQRYKGEIEMFRPDPTEVQTLGLVEGATCTLHVTQIMEIRGGNPVVRCRISNLVKPKAA